MKIQNYLNQAGVFDGKRVEDRSPKISERRREEQSGTQSSDHVSLSSEGRLRALAMHSAMDDPGVRTERVQELKTQVQSGTYSPDSRRTAVKLLQEELDLAAGLQPSALDR